MSKPCCIKSKAKKNQDCCTDSSQCCAILCGEKAQGFSDEGASCVINCKNKGNCCVKDSSLEIRCKGATGTCCEIDCGCCTVAVEKYEDDNGPCCKIICCADKDEDKKECVLRCNTVGSSDGQYCVIKCGVTRLTTTMVNRDFRHEVWQEMLRYQVLK